MTGIFLSRHFCVCKSLKTWWTRPGSNRRPPRCERGEKSNKAWCCNHLRFLNSLQNGQLGQPEKTDKTGKPENEKAQEVRCCRARDWETAFSRFAKRRACWALAPALCESTCNVGRSREGLSADGGNLGVKTLTPSLKTRPESEILLERMATAIRWWISVNASAEAGTACLSRIDLSAPGATISWSAASTPGTVARLRDPCQC
jgi:hypothetical protein